ncbi:MAG: LamG-like jellyroll fold domain-containing protein [Comamonas sp.]
MRYTASATALLVASLLSACGGGEDASLRLAPDTTKAVGASYWAGVGRALPASPLGNKVAISCHNCYGDSVAATQTKVAKALARQFDLVELDLTLHADGKVYVEHNDSELPHGTLQASLANTSLQQSDRMLFLEVKEGYTSAAQSDVMMLSVLRSIRHQQYASAERPAFIRAFMDGRQQHLVRAKQLLAMTEFAGIRNHIRFHTLIESNIRNNVRATKNLGFDGVEFEYRSTDLFGNIQQAKALGLGVGLYTIPAHMGEAYLSALREDVDILTTDYDLDTNAKTSNVRALVQEGTGLLYLNTATQASYPLQYQRANATSYQLPSGVGAPALEWLAPAADEDRVGGSMVFAGGQSLTTWDADNTADGGYLVTAVVNFDDLAPKATASILAKSDGGGFALEQTGTGLRFGVHVNGTYYYATAPLSTFNGTQSYFIIGAYDGNGAVRLWVNNREQLPSVSISGGVTHNNSPVVIGADPQGATERRFHFSGKIQQVMVQKWRDH